MNFQLIAGIFLFIALFIYFLTWKGQKKLEKTIDEVLNAPDGSLVKGYVSDDGELIIDEISDKVSLPDRERKRLKNIKKKTKENLKVFHNLILLAIFLYAVAIIV